VVGVILNLSIWFAHTPVVQRDHAGRSLGLSFDMPVLSSIDIAAFVLSAAAARLHFQYRHALGTGRPG
jgi:chromate transporter